MNTATAGRDRTPSTLVSMIHAHIPIVPYSLKTCERTLEGLEGLEAFLYLPRCSVGCPQPIRMGVVACEAERERAEPKAALAAETRPRRIPGRNATFGSFSFTARLTLSFRCRSGL